MGLSAVFRGQDARAPRNGTACLIVSPEAARRARPSPAPLGPRNRGRLPRERGRPARSGPKAHGCSSGQDARAPRNGTACLIVSPEAARRARPSPAPLGPRNRGRLPRERGRPARMWAEGPQWFKRARCPRSQERHRLSHRNSRGDSTRSTLAGPARSPEPRAPSPGTRASRPHVGRRPTVVQAGKMPALPGTAPPVSSKFPRRLDALDPRRPRSVPGAAGAFPGTAGVPPACGPKAHGCSSGQDARAPRNGTACLIVSPEATRHARPTPAPLGPRNRGRLPRDRGRPARMWAEGPRLFKRARCPRSDDTCETPPERHEQAHSRSAE